MALNPWNSEEYFLALADGSVYVQIQEPSKSTIQSVLRSYGGTVTQLSIPPLLKSIIPLVTGFATGPLWSSNLGAPPARNAAGQPRRVFQGLATKAAFHLVAHAAATMLDDNAGPAMAGAQAATTDGAAQSAGGDTAGGGFSDVDVTGGEIPILDAAPVAPAGDITGGGFPFADTGGGDPGGTIDVCEYM